MKSWAYALARDGSVKEISPELACGARNGDAFTWVHLNGAEEDAVAWLREHADLPPPVIAALTAVETRPRTEQIDGGALVNLRGLRDEDDGHADELVSIRLWAEQGRAISLTFRKLGGILELRDRMAKGTILDPGDLIAALAVSITARLDPEVAALGDLIDDCETRLDPDNAFEMRRAIARGRSAAIGYRRFVVPQRQALERLATLEAGWLEDEDRIHLRQAADGFARMAEELEAVRERSALMHEQLTDLRAELIETRTLTLSIVALVFLPLTFVTGLLGMNVDGIPYAHAPWAFWGVVAVCTALAFGIAGYFVSVKWFRR